MLHPVFIMVSLLARHVKHFSNEPYKVIACVDVFCVENETLADRSIGCVG